MEHLIDREKKKTVLQVDGTCPTIAEVVEVIETDSGIMVITETGGDLGKVTNMLEENDGKVCLKFVMSGNGNVVIEKARIFIDWSYMDDVWLGIRHIIDDIIWTIRMILYEG